MCEVVWFFLNLWMFLLFILCLILVLNLRDWKKVVVVVIFKLCVESDLFLRIFFLIWVFWMSVVLVLIEVMMWVLYFLISNCVLYYVCFEWLFCNLVVICINLFLKVGCRFDLGCVFIMYMKWWSWIFVVIVLLLICFFLLYLKFLVKELFIIE